MLSKLLTRELENKNKTQEIKVDNSTTEQLTAATLVNNAESNTATGDRQKLQDMLNLLNGKEKIEALMKQKNLALKYITGKTYKESKKRDLRWVHFTMI